MQAVYFVKITINSSSQISFTGSVFTATKRLVSAEMTQNDLLPKHIFLLHMLPNTNMSEYG